MKVKVIRLVKVRLRPASERTACFQHGLHPPLRGCDGRGHVGPLKLQLECDTKTHVAHGWRPLRYGLQLQ